MNLCEVCALFAEIQAARDDEQLSPLSPERVLRATKLMKARAGQGIDQMSPVDIQRLPGEGFWQAALLAQQEQFMLAIYIRTLATQTACRGWPCCMLRCVCV